MSGLEIMEGDALERLRELADESVQCCVTSPPYWGLRDYSTNGQLGLEKTPEEYVAKMVEIFREVRRVLRKDGTLWLNLGDSYASNWGMGAQRPSSWWSTVDGNPEGKGWGEVETAIPPNSFNGKNGSLKVKDLCGIPWRVAFALQADGWWLRSDIIWAKPNPMPESVTDRPTKAHEYLFLLTKAASYFYDAEAIKEKNSEGSIARFGLGENGQTRTWNTENNKRDGRTDGTKSNEGFRDHVPVNRNKRSVWTVATAPYPEAHFATYPPDLIKPCILAGTSAKGCCGKCGAPWERMTEIERLKPATPSGNRELRRWDDNCESGIGDRTKTKTIGWEPTCGCPMRADSMLVYDKPAYTVEACTVLDPFAGSGTTGAVALELGRRAVLIELNPKYVALIEQRCDVTLGLQLA